MRMEGAPIRPNPEEEDPTIRRPAEQDQTMQNMGKFAGSKAGETIRAAAALGALYMASPEDGNDVRQREQPIEEVVQGGGGSLTDAELEALREGRMEYSPPPPPEGMGHPGGGVSIPPPTGEGESDPDAVPPLPPGPPPHPGGGVVPGGVPGSGVPLEGEPDFPNNRGGEIDSIPDEDIERSA